MSPRRRFGDDVDSTTNFVSSDYFRMSAEPARRWGLPLAAVLAAVMMGAAIAASALMLVRHEADRRAVIQDAAAQGFARDFMTMYMTLDPSEANAYADRVLAQGTGDFANMFAEKRNAILMRVARAELSIGTVLDAGIQGRNDDGSVDVLLATEITTITPDGASTVESGSRWVATTIKESGQWKISRLVQVI